MSYENLWATRASSGRNLEVFSRFLSMLRVAGEGRHLVMPMEKSFLLPETALNSPRTQFFMHQRESIPLKNVNRHTLSPHFRSASIDSFQTWSGTNATKTANESQNVNENQENNLDSHFVFPVSYFLCFCFAHEPLLSTSISTEKILKKKFGRNENFSSRLTVA